MSFNRPVRLRFAPSPTGALHIGGVRTALFNYLMAKRLGGSFILRVEDTDQTRFVEGAEDYLMKALNWLGLNPDESPQTGGPHAPYRQSERKAIYAQYAEQLVKSGYAYYAFDSNEALNALRAEAEAEKKTFKYDAISREKLDNSLTISPQELQARLEAKQAYIIRIKLPAEEEVSFDDEIRGQVKFNSKDLDDKVLLKEDGMPTYHLANVVDDYLMEISHVIRGEEWLPSTPLHVYLYRYLGWADKMPKFAHLPLILRPDGKGKLSKRDGAKFGFPVFPLDWAAQEVLGFDGQGFLPQAVLNFLALLGWSPSENREVLSLQEMIAEFDLANVHKSGARFDFEKAKWFNQQYLIQSKNEDFAALLPAHLGSKDYLTQVCGLMKERVYFLSDIAKTGHFFFRAPDYEQVKIEQEKDLQKKVLAKWPEVKDKMSSLISGLDSQTKTWTRDFIHDLVQELMPAHGLKTSEVFPFLRLAVSGSLQGPDLFAVLATLDSNESITRLKAFRAWCNKSVT